MTVVHRRKARVAETIDAAKAICAEGDVTPERLARIELLLADLAQEEDLFPEEEFGLPADETLRLYRVAEDSDGTFALYLHIANVPAEVPPHNHTTWACIAGIGGDEKNFLYETDLKSAPVQVDARSVRKGETVSLMPGDVHSIRAVGDTQLKNLHLYGLALEKLVDRVFWSEENKSWSTVPPTSGIIERRA
ncbi:hypothetical protein [Roseovarius atlanticus]|uniref:cysteine dioxygenase family protein n=1 Tax=Roseovarius atlanticus TaxID=1641875 RepID=UPI001C939022|nr:hypothetical protein [Roseovarius atlanticus]MBY5986443.1 hypothetical protein [Roseovarius atlanticus]MBY6125083.1 hypothetical protein [Roseovarius atlanticus]MBY6150456.1 hypothetical protein [Roseovarius atlanticus]